AGCFILDSPIKTPGLWGCREIAVKGRHLYANSFEDLLVPGPSRISSAGAESRYSHERPVWAGCAGQCAVRMRRRRRPGRFQYKIAHTPGSCKSLRRHMYIDVIPYNGVLTAYARNGVRFSDISKPQKPVR